MTHSASPLGTWSRQIRRGLGWLFRAPRAAPVWLLVRLYLAFTWGSFAVQKLLDGWLSGDPMYDLMLSVADAEASSAPFPFYRDFAQWLVDAGLTPLMSVGIPLAELAIGAAMLVGLGLAPVALLAVGLNLNFILSGIAPILFDLRIIALQLLLLGAWRVAGDIGLGRALARWRVPTGAPAAGPLPATVTPLVRSWPVAEAEPTPSTYLTRAS